MARWKIHFMVLLLVAFGTWACGSDDGGGTDDTTTADADRAAELMCSAAEQLSGSRPKRQQQTHRAE